MKPDLDQRCFPLIFDSIHQGIFTIDQESRITSFNRAAERMTGYSREEALGKRCYDIFRAELCQTDCPLKRSVEGKETVEDREVTILTRDGSELPIAISTAALKDENGQVVGGVEMFRDLSPLVELRKKLTASYEFEDIVSKNPAMRTILERLPLFAASASTVVIEGASGTGKELVARALHNLGPRAKKPFISVNCAALPENLLESELFGYVRGAFTDAKKDKPGRFALADGGTLFLDEIGDLPPAMQVKILRVLQEREFEPLGGIRPVKVDVRIIAATNRDLEKEVAEGRFREDLFYRLNVIRIRMPKLADRREDIPLLVDHFIRRFNALQGRNILRASRRALAALMAAPFFGNVRELENAIEHAFVICRGDTIRLAHLPAVFQPEDALSETIPPAEDALQAAEADILAKTLARHNGNRRRTAEALGISRNTLWRKMKRHGLLER